MSLPVGYKQLQYITSTGEQYIDTGFVPNQDSGLVIDFSLGESFQNNNFCGCRRTTSAQAFAFSTSSSKWRFGYNNSSSTSSTAADAGRHIAEINKNVCSVDGVVFDTRTYAAFDGYTSFVIFGIQASSIYSGWGTVYSCRLFDNGVLVRDLVPCKNHSGSIGMYDVVGGLFYGNAGTGEFTAGPELAPDVDAPPYMAIVSQDADSAVLEWGSVENAVGYRLYRDGVLILDTQDTQAQVDVESFSVADYAVAAYGENFESGKTVLRVSALPVADLLPYLIFTRVQADVDAGNALGMYNATDLNRVSEACNYIRYMFASYGYAVPDVLRTNWTASDIPRQADMAAYLRTIRGLCALVVFMKQVPALPFDMARFGFTSANNIEEALYHLGRIAENIPATWYECGQIESGVAYIT